MSALMPRFRRSMALPHAWAGFSFGWLLFVVFVMGTLAYFQDEITFWMRPELHKARSGDQGLAHALSLLEHEAPHAAQWTLTLPSPRTPVIQIQWTEAAGKAGKQPKPRPTDANTAWLDPATGERLFPRETASCRRLLMDAPKRK